jgi:hypothetical protein
LFAALRDSRFHLPTVFVSSNRNDYGKPHERIEADLAAAGARFAGDLIWARAIVNNLIG